MLFNYTAIDKNGQAQKGSIEAPTAETAIGSLQRRGLVISSIDPVYGSSRFNFSSWFESVSNKDVVILSRQMATLFEAQVTALRVFRLLGEASENPLIQRSLNGVADSIQGGSTIAAALSHYPKVFSPFYVNMVRSGEESGKLDEVLLYLADYLDRSYNVTTKARNALIYPAFVIGTFITVMVLMLTLVVPRLSAIIIESGLDIPVFTQIIIAISNAFTNYGILILLLVIIVGIFLWKYIQTDEGKLRMDYLKINTPYIGDLFKKVYLSRIADNMTTMLGSGIEMVRALDITASVVGNSIFERDLLLAIESVKGGQALSQALDPYDEIPSIMVQMIKVGEESGKLSDILGTLAKFYEREVTNAVDSLVNMIEPVMIVALGLGVGILMASVLMPIYNISLSI